MTPAGEGDWCPRQGDGHAEPPSTSWGRGKACRGLFLCRKKATHKQNALESLHLGQGSYCHTPEAKAVTKRETRHMSLTSLSGPASSKSWGNALSREENDGGRARMRGLAHCALPELSGGPPTCSGPAAPRGGPRATGLGVAGQPATQLGVSRAEGLPAREDDQLFNYPRNQ